MHWSRNTKRALATATVSFIPFIGAGTAYADETSTQSGCTPNLGQDVLSIPGTVPMTMADEHQEYNAWNQALGEDLTTILIDQKLGGGTDLIADAKMFATNSELIIVHDSTSGFVPPC